MNSRCADIRSCKHPNNTQKRVRDYKEIDRSLPVLSKLHLQVDVMISIDTIFFKQGVQHLNLVWFLPSKCKVLSRENGKLLHYRNYKTSGMYILFEDLCTCHCMFFPQRERGKGQYPWGMRQF